MSINILVTGKFKNGKERVAGFHSECNMLIKDSDLGRMYNTLQKNIVQDFDRFKSVKVAGDISFTSSLKAPLHFETQVNNLKALSYAINKTRVNINNAQS